MRIIQILPTLAIGDAVGNNAITLQKHFEKKGIFAPIYAENFGLPDPLPCVYSISDFPKYIDSNDILIYHMASAWDFIYKLGQLSCKKIMIYHNLTPAHFFSQYNHSQVILMKKAERQMSYLSHTFDYCLCDSEYNKQSLIDFGYTCPIDVLPIFIPFHEYDALPDLKTIQKYQDNCINLLFVGRIAPNKKQEDIIAAFHQYKKHYQKNSRLLLVGSAGGFENYKDRLRHYTETLDLTEQDVIFTGHITFPELLAYYTVAHVFVSMSEHEGFGVPLIEAMHFSLPIVAYSSSAVPDTVGEGGLLLETKDPSIAAGAIHEILTNQELSRYTRQKQEEKLAVLSENRIKSLLEDYLRKIYPSF